MTRGLRQRCGDAAAYNVRTDAGHRVAKGDVLKNPIELLEEIIEAHRAHIAGGHPDYQFRAKLHEIRARELGEEPATEPAEDATEPPATVATIVDAEAEPAVEPEPGTAAEPTDAVTATAEAPADAPAPKRGKAAKATE